MQTFSGTTRPFSTSRTMLHCTAKITPILAAKASDGAVPKPRRTRKVASSAAEPPADPSLAATAAPAPADRSLHRLHNTSDTLRALLERRAERQQRQMSSAGTSTATPLTSRPAAPLSPAEPPTARGKVKVRFWLQFRVEYGQHIVVVGGAPELGKWILADGVPLQWSEGDMWNTTVDIPAGSVLEYKYVVVNQGGHSAAWQTGNNSVLAIRQADDVVEVYDNWGGNPGAQVVAAGAAPVTRESRLLSWATELEAQVAGQRQELRRARMELVAAQEDARLAREESKRLKVQLAQSEAQRVAAVANLKQAETVNQILQTQLVETTTSFSEALEKAVELLGPASSPLKGNGNSNGTAGTTATANSNSSSTRHVESASATPTAAAGARKP